MFGIKRWGRLMLPAVAALLFLLGAFGCGNGEEEAANGEEEINGEEEVDEAEEVNGEKEAVDDEEEAEELPVAVDDWRNPTDLMEIVNSFEELEWRWAQVQDGEEIDSTVVSYHYQGTETVEGDDTDVLVFSVDDEQVKFWIDENGDAVQGESEGMVMTGEPVQQIWSGVSHSVFSPFRYFDTFGLREALVEEVPGIEQSVVSTETEQFGEMSAEVTRLEVDVGPPATPEGEDGTATWGVGDFGEFQMSVEWNWEDIDGESVTYNLTRVVPR